MGTRRRCGSARSSSAPPSASASTRSRSRGCWMSARSASSRARATRWTGWRNSMPHMKTAWIVIGVIVLLALVAGGQFVSARNDLVRQREAINGQWADVEAVLQRRADLIPNLVATVKGFAAHETEVFKDIADARAAFA